MKKSTKKIVVISNPCIKCGKKSIETHKNRLLKYYECTGCKQKWATR